MESQRRDPHIKRVRNIVAMMIVLMAPAYSHLESILNDGGDTNETLLDEANNDGVYILSGRTII